MTTSSTRCRRPRARCSSASRVGPMALPAATFSWSAHRPPLSPRPASLLVPRAMCSAACPWSCCCVFLCMPAVSSVPSCHMAPPFRSRLLTRTPACCAQSMLQADNIAYSMSAVRGIADIVEKVEEVDKDTCHTVVLLNCGASEDLIGLSLRATYHAHWVLTTGVISLHSGEVAGGKRARVNADTRRVRASQSHRSATLK